MTVCSLCVYIVLIDSNGLRYDYNLNVIFNAGGVYIVIRHCHIVLLESNMSQKHGPERATKTLQFNFR